MTKIFTQATLLLAFAAGAFTATAQTETFEPVSNRYATVAPEQGVYAELSEFTINLSDAFKNDYIEKMGYDDKIKLIDETTGTTVSLVDVTNGTGKVTVKLRQTVTEPGHYLLDVPEDALGYEDDYGYESIQAMSFRFWVEKESTFEPISNRIATISPEQGIVKSLEKFTLSFSDAFAGNYIEGSSTVKAKLLNEDSGEAVATASVKSGTQTAELTLDKAVTEAGHYILDIPEGALFYEDDFTGSESIQALKFRYWIEAGEEPDPTPTFEPIENRYGSVDPEQGVYGKLQTITLKLGTGYAGEFIEGYSMKPVILVNEDTEETVATFKVTNGTGQVTLSLDEPFKTTGHYLLQVPEGGLGYEDEYGEWNDIPAMTFRYWINPKAGVEMIENEAPASFDIYNMQGVCMLRNASIDDLRSLPKGIYIANQRKYLVH